MRPITKLAVAAVAFIHFGFAAVEALFAKTAVGMQILHITAQQLALKGFPELLANQGLSNGIMGLCLLVALYTRSKAVIVTFLGSIVFAGIFGAASTGNASILAAQSAPALVALLMVLTEKQPD